MTQDTEVEKFDAWVAAFENQHGAIDEESALCAWQARAALEAKQAGENLNCKSVQKRLATQWGFVKQAEPECLTCNDHGAVGNAINGDLCPDCTLPRMAREAKQAEVQMPEPAGWRDPTNLLPSQGCTYMRAIHEKWPHIYREALYTEQQLRTLLAQHGIKIAD